MRKIVNTKSNLEFASSLCEFIHRDYLSVLKTDQRFNIGLTGGNSPILIYDHLRNHYLDEFDWKKIYFYFIDERDVPHNSLDSNFFNAYEHLLKYLPEANYYRYKTEFPPESVISEYLTLLKGINIHTAILGMGEDGHVGSIFPNSKEENADTQLVYTADEYNGFKRFSFSLEKINEIANKYLLINNSDAKKKIITSNNAKFPINRIHNMTILINEFN